MRKCLIVWAALVLLVSCCAAAEEDRQIVAEFDDFVLRTAVALDYRGEKADGSPLFLFYPSAEGNVAMTAVNAVWNRSTEPMTPEEFSEVYRETEAGIRTRYEAGGRALKSYDVGETVEKELWGLPALLCDADLVVSINDTDVSLVQRGIRVTGSFGTYLFSLSAWSPELLEEATDTLIRSLEWK